MILFMTGVSGFIGGSIAQQLIKEGHQIRGLVRSEEKANSIEGNWN